MPKKKTEDANRSGWVYILHFATPLGTPGGHIAQHYAGSTIDPRGRLAAHQAGTAGVRMTEVCRERGIAMEFGAVGYVCGDLESRRECERRLKKRKHLATYCEVCSGAMAKRISGTIDARSLFR